MTQNIEASRKIRPIAKPMAKLLELGILVLFLWWLCRQELELMAHFGQSHPLALGIWRFLNDLMPGVMPSGFWFLTWPLGCAALAFTFFGKWRWYFLALAGFFSSLLLTADRLYFHFFSSVVPASSFNAVGQLWDVRHSVTSELSFGSLAQAMAFLGFGAVGYVSNRWFDSSLRNAPAWFIADKVVGIVLFLLTFYAAYVAFYIPSRYVVVDLENNLTIYDAEPRSGDRYVPIYESSYLDYAKVFGVFNFHIKNLRETLENTWQKDELPPEALAVTVTQLERKHALNRTESPFWGIAEGRNVFLISLESFQHFLWDLTLDDTEVTPVLNELRERGLYWDYLIDQNKAGGTSDAEFAVLTGLLPDIRRIASLSTPTENDLLALPQTLKETGYGTFSLHGYRPSFWNRNLNHPRFGIDTMLFEDSFPRAEPIGMGLPDEILFTHGLSLIADAPTPFFAFFITLSNHHPYLNVPDSYRDFFPSAPQDSEVGRYFRLARYTDDALGVFLEGAKAAGFWENSMFVLYGDHVAPLSTEGQQFCEKGLGLSIRSVREMRVPFLVFMPGLEESLVPAPTEYANVLGGLQDVYPTVLHLLGIEIPFGLYGTHLFVPNRHRDPIPHLRKGGGFFFQGVFYDGEKHSALRDEQGLVYVPEPGLELSTPEEIEDHYRKSAEAIFLHFRLFDYDAQKKAIAEKRRLSR